MISMVFLITVLSSLPLILDISFINLEGLNIWLIFFSLYITLLIVIANLDNFNMSLIVLIGLFSALAFYTHDLLTFFLAFESVLLPIVILLLIIGSRNRKLFASNNFLYYTLFTSLVFLVGIIYIWNRTGSTDFNFTRAYSFSEMEQLLLVMSFMLAFSAKLPLMPFHYWLLEAHVESVSSASIMLAAILLKLGNYLKLMYRNQDDKNCL